MQEKEKKHNPKEENKFIKNLFTHNKLISLRGLRVNLNKSPFCPPF